MESGVQQQEQQPHISCTSCGRKFRYKPQLAGRTVKCPCGSAIMVPKPHAETAAVEADEGEYDFAPAPDPQAKLKPPAPAGTSAARIAPPVGLAAPAGAADALLPSHASIPTTVLLPPQRKGLKPEEKKAADDEELAKPSALRDWIVPSILIVIGIVLRFVEVMSPAATQDTLAFGPAVGAVMMKLVLSIGLLLGGMFLAVQILEVCFIGALHRTAYKLISIAVAPGALYGILSCSCGVEYGAMIGTFASVLVYGLLFALLMRLDLKDASMCVLMTWILITAANYVAYKVEGLLRDSWV